MAKELDIKSEKVDTGLNAGATYESIERGNGSRRKKIPASEQEKKKRQSEMKTQGIKGAGMARLNTSLTPENQRTIKIMASVSGMTQTQALNTIIARYRKDHADLFEQCENILNEFAGDPE